jgi:hypothetical protein
MTPPQQMGEQTAASPTHHRVLEMDFSVAAPSGQSQLWKVAIIVVVLWASLALCLRYQHDLEPRHCDPFGYARQAELFREQGPVRGLDTAIDAPQGQLLITLAKAAFPDNPAWFDAVAPHCHHYDPHGDKIILQYPPGTGAFLALFPFAFAMPFLQIAGSLLVACLVTWLAISYRLTRVSMLAITISVAFLFWVLARNLAYWSASVPLTLLLIPLVAALGAKLTTKPRYVALCFGFAFGVLILIRLPNILLLLGPLLEEGISARLWQWRNVKRHAAVAVAMGLGLLPGIVPLLLANRINTGSIFHTTYPPRDTTAPVLHAGMVWESLKYYFTAPLGAPLLIAALGFIALGILAWTKSRDRELPAGTIGAAGMLLVSIAFFATHLMQTHYYLIASSFMAMTMITLELSTREKKTRAPMVYLWLLPLLVIAFIAVKHVKPYAPNVDVPEEVMNPQAVVWADVDSGTLQYFKRRYAGKLHKAEPSMQDALVDLVRQAHHEQYFVIDSPLAQQVCNRQAARYGVTYAGTVTYTGTANAISPEPVWKLGGGDARTCGRRPGA